MTRFVSVWLPRWRVQRYLMAEARKASPEPVENKHPFVLAADAAGGPRVVALNAAASAEGLGVGQSVADARARVGILQVRSADPAADALALHRLALWATRYTPAAAAWKDDCGADGLFLDITGAAHLFGGEETMLRDVLGRLKRLGLSARAAMAGTPGAAWGLSHYASSPTVILEPEREAEALAALPVEALRLSSETRKTLRRLGFKRIGALIGNSRAPFASRFPPELLKRLDQALGRAPEPLDWITPPPRYRILRQLLEPITTQEAIVLGATQLMNDLVADLVRDGVGARALQLALYRTDGEAVIVDIALTMPTRSCEHVARLIDLRLDRIAGTFDTGFGFEAMALSVLIFERMEAKQSKLVSNFEDSKKELSGALIDKLQQRLGSDAVRRIKPVASHLPERAERLCGAGTMQEWPPTGEKLRPILLLHPPIPAEIVSSVPEGPPRRLKWRRGTHKLVKSDGPERIAPEWWRSSKAEPERDYYLVEDERGRRFWIYREAFLQMPPASPRWFVHGLFA